MAEIRIPQSTRRLQPQATAQRITPGTIPSGGKDLADLGEALIEVEGNIAKVRNLQQVTDAQIGANKEIRTLQEKAILDPDLDTNLPGYNEQVSEVYNRWGGTISDASSRAKYNGKSALQSTALQFELGKEARKTMSAKSKQGLDDILNDLKGSFFNARTPEIKQQIIDQAINEVQDRIDLGVIDQIKGKARIDVISDEFRQADIEKIIEADPDIAFQILKSGQHGITDTELVKDLTDKASGRIAVMNKKGEVLLSDLETRNELDLLDTLMNDQLTAITLREFQEENTIRQDFAAAVEDNFLSSSKFVEVSDSKTVVDFEKNALGSRTKGQTNELMLDIIKANTDGLLSVADMRSLVGKINGQFQNAANQSRDNILKQGMSKIGNWISTLGDGSADTERNLQLKLLRSFEAGEPIDETKLNDEVRNLIKNEVITQRPELTTVEDVNAIADEGGLTTIDDEGLSQEITSAKSVAEKKGEILVKELATGDIGTMTEEEFNADPDKFERL